MAPLRIGVTGSGFMGRTHADAAHRLEGTELVAVSSDPVVNGLEPDSPAQDPYGGAGISGLQRLEGLSGKQRTEFNKLQKRLRGNTGKAIIDYNMIEDGDKIIPIVEVWHPRIQVANR